MVVGSTERSAGLALSVSCPPRRPQPRQIGEMRAVGHQAAGFDKALEGVRRPQSARGCKTDKPAMIAIRLEKMGLPATRPLAPRAKLTVLADPNRGERRYRPGRRGVRARSNEGTPSKPEDPG